MRQLYSLGAAQWSGRRRSLTTLGVILHLETAMVAWNLILSLFVAVLTIAWILGSRYGQPGASAGRIGVAIGIAVWISGALALAAVTHFADFAQLCSSSTVTKNEVVSTEEGGSEPKRTTTEPSSETTRTCDGMSVAQVGLLFLPGLFLLLPILKDIDVSGIFKLTFTELEKKLDEQAESVSKVANDVAQLKVTQDTIVRMGVTLNIFGQAGLAGRFIREGEAQQERGDIVSINESIFGEM